MKNIQKYIPGAIEVAEKHLAKNGKISEKMNGYISSFGASVISAGLLPTLVFFSQKGESEGREKLVKVLEALLKKEGMLNSDEQLLKKVKDLVKPVDNTTDKVAQEAQNKAELNKLTDDIYRLIVALKLAIRIFPKSKKQKS